MKEIELIRCLLDEIEQEKKYAEDRDKAIEKALKKAKEHSDIYNCSYWQYMPEEFERIPNDAKIKRCAMLIREVCLKMYK